jgi:hypothetical protein
MEAGIWNMETRGDFFEIIRGASFYLKDYIHCVLLISYFDDQENNKNRLPSTPRNDDYTKTTVNYIMSLYVF